MKTLRTIRPGKPGSKRFQRHWGDKLVAVRYRRDEHTDKIFTTVEIIVDRREIAPENVLLTSSHARRRHQAVAVVITWEEKPLREQAKLLGARWSRIKRVWVMRYDTAVTLGIQDRVVPGLVEECVDVDTSIEL